MAHKATARTRLKYKGVHYAPGDEVEFDSKKDAAPYEAEALEPEPKAGARKSARRAPEAAATAEEGTPDPLEGVTFASPQAKLRAVELGHTAETYKHQRKTGETRGGESAFAIADVDRIEAKEE